MVRSLLTLLSGLAPVFAQVSTNGLSDSGTLDEAPLPNFLGNNDASFAPAAAAPSAQPTSAPAPWGNLRIANTNFYRNSPAYTSGRARYYDLTITRGKIAPDGVEREVTLVNGKFPGPLLSADVGDIFHVTVHNKIDGPPEGTSLHWHGFLQSGTPAHDGAPGVQQCPIAPSASFTYVFEAETPGTSWYHSHYSAQYNAGVLGPMVVHGPIDSRRNSSQFPYDIDKKPIVLSDWYHDEYYKLVQQAMVSTAPGDVLPSLVYSVNNLIDGRNYDCPYPATNNTCQPKAGFSKYRFQTGKVHRLRLINAGSEGTQLFSIDGHEMTVIAEDFIPVVPRTQTHVTLGIGQRTDVLVTATGKDGDAYWMRSEIVCSLTRQPHARAAIYYPKADTKALPPLRPYPFNTSDPKWCNNDDLNLTAPSYNYGPAEPPIATQEFQITAGQNKSGNWYFSMTDLPMRINYNNPILLNAASSNYTYEPEWNVFQYDNLKTNASQIRFVMYNRTPAPHPMHLHGHNFQVLAVGNGEKWDGNITNAQNPARRDTYILPRQDPNTGIPGYLVIQTEQKNPGVWPLHCHIAWHVSQGLGVAIVESPQDLRKNSIANVLNETCGPWNVFPQINVPVQIDSGLRKERVKRI